MKNTTSGLVVVLSLFAGLAGGMASSWLLAIRPVKAQSSTPITKALRTERLEIVDKQGKVLGTFEILPSGFPRLLVGSTDMGVGITSQGVVVKNGDGIATLGPLAGQMILGKVGVTIIEPNSSSGLWVGTRGISMQTHDLRAGLIVAPDQDSASLILGRGDSPRVMVGMVDGEGSISIFNRRGVPTWGTP